MRIDYAKIAPAALAAMGASGKYSATASIPARLRYLVELRVSQINGCAYCMDLHSHDARTAGESQQRLDCLIAWAEAPFFTDAERAALEWAEALTTLHPDHVSDAVYERVRGHFSELELVDLTVIISMMNAWNRLAISMRKGPAPRPA